MSDGEQYDAKECFKKGEAYRTGEGVEQSDAEAVKWHTLAADQGDARAQYNLGWMYENGKGVEQFI